MNKLAKITVVSAIVATTGLFAAGATAGWGEHREYCERGEARGGPAMMMKRMGKHGPFSDRDLDLSAEEARTLVEARLIMRGNDRLKVGKVSEKDSDTYLVDIVTVDESLVRQIEIDRDSGFPRGPVNPDKD